MFLDLQKLLGLFSEIKLLVDAFGSRPRRLLSRFNA
jgi:hypothetical protein